MKDKDIEKVKDSEAFMLGVRFGIGVERKHARQVIESYIEACKRVNEGLTADDMCIILKTILTDIEGMEARR